MWEFFLIEHRAQVQHAILLLLCVYAWQQGDGPEKSTAFVLLSMVMLDYFYHLMFTHNHPFDRIIWGHFVIDVIILVAMIPIAMRANRIYPLCILAAQLISTIMHLNRGIVPTGMEFAYWLLTRAPSYIQLVAFTLGLIAHRRRKKLYGSHRSWRKSSRQ